MRAQPTPSRLSRCRLLRAGSSSVASASMCSRYGLDLRRRFWFPIEMKGRYVFGVQV